MDQCHHYTVKHYNKGHKDFKCDICDKSFSNLRKHIKIVHTKNHKCNSCDKKFFLPSLLKKHTKNFHENYKCDYCDKSISGELYLKRHIDKHNNDDGPKNHKCDTCGKSFSKAWHLRSHIQKTHEIEGDQYEDLLELIDGKWIMRSI